MSHSSWKLRRWFPLIRVGQQGEQNQSDECLILPLLPLKENLRVFCWYLRFAEELSNFTKPPEGVRVRIKVSLTLESP